YLNIKGYCFFANTGTFNYESKSKERNYLLNPISQNGLKFIDNKEYVSDINIIKNNRELLQFEGYLSKINTRDSIYRTISITNNEINIKDEGNCNFTSQFILLPDVNFIKVNDHEFILQRDSLQLKIVSEKKFNIEECWI